MTNGRFLESPYTRYVRHLAGLLPQGIYNGRAERKRPATPTQASSEFLINRRLGDWAEDTIRQSVMSSTNYVVVKYGRARDTVAGEPGFKESFEMYQDELDRFGKRPDLLIFRRQDYSLSTPDLSESDDSEVAGIVRRAIAAIEVRSSNYLTRRYVPGKSSRFPELSFTIKVEDLHIVMTWVQNTGVPHYYAQVTLDEVHAIGFHKALLILSNPNNENARYSIKRVPKNQFKTTLNIPFSQGVKIGDITEDPSIDAVRRELPSGRLLFYVKFSGGTLTPIPGIWEKVFLEAERIKQNPAD